MSHNCFLPPLSLTTLFIYLFLLSALKLNHKLLLLFAVFVSNRLCRDYTAVFHVSYESHPTLAFFPTQIFEHSRAVLFLFSQFYFFVTDRALVNILELLRIGTAYCVQLKNLEGVGGVCQHLLMIVYYKVDCRMIFLQFRYVDMFLEMAILQFGSGLIAN